MAANLTEVREAELRMIKSALGIFVPQFGASIGARARMGRDRREDFSGGNTRCSLKIELCDKLRAPSNESC